MGYLFLVVATFFGLVKGYCGKRVSGFVRETKDAVFSNLLRMALCSAIGVIAVIVSGGFSEFNVGWGGFLISALSGAANAVFVVAWLFAVKFGAYMLVDVFLTLGLAVPITLCAILFGEEMKWNHYFGFLLLIVAVLILCSYNNNIKKKLNVKSLLLLVLCSLSFGTSSFTQKWFVRYSGGALVSSFNFYTYVIAALLLCVCFLIMKKPHKEEKSDFKIKSVFIFIIIMAAGLFLNSYLMTLAAPLLPAVVLYPLNTGLSLVLSAAMSSILYKEKLSVKCIIGILLAFISLIIINIL